MRGIRSNNDGYKRMGLPVIESVGDHCQVYRLLNHLEVAGQRLTKKCFK